MRKEVKNLKGDEGSIIVEVLVDILEILALDIIALSHKVCCFYMYLFFFISRIEVAMLNKL